MILIFCPLLSAIIVGHIRGRGEQENPKRARYRRNSKRVSYTAHALRIAYYCYLLCVTVTVGVMLFLTLILFPFFISYFSLNFPLLSFPLASSLFFFAPLILSSALLLFIPLLSFPLLLSYPRHFSPLLSPILSVPQGWRGASFYHRGCGRMLSYISQVRTVSIMMESKTGGQKEWEACRVYEIDN